MREDAERHGRMVVKGIRSNFNFMLSGGTSFNTNVEVPVAAPARCQGGYLTPLEEFIHRINHPRIFDNDDYFRIIYKYIILMLGH